MHDFIFAANSSNDIRLCSQSGIPKKRHESVRKGGRKGRSDTRTKHTVSSVIR